MLTASFPMDVLAPLFLHAHVGQFCAPSCHRVYFIHRLSLSATRMLHCIFGAIVLCLSIHDSHVINRLAR